MSITSPENQAKRNGGTMRKIVALAAALVLIAGCGKSASTSTTPPSAITSIYLQTVQSNTPGMTDAGRVKIAKQICTLFDQKDSWVEVLAATIKGGLTAYQAGAVIASATATYCPDHDSELPPA